MSTTEEDQTVRQYRYLLRTAPVDALEAGHLEALGGLDDAGRAAVLTAVQRGLVAGQRLTPDAVPAIARLVVRGERRAPGEFRRACDPAVLARLASGVVGAEASFGWFAGYAEWDGAEAEPDDVGVDHGGERRAAADGTAEARAYAHTHQQSVQGWGGGSA